MAGRPLFVYPNCINRQCRTADRRLHPPYISKGTILKNQLFDHTSIIKTVRDIHIPDSAPLTIRESVVGSLSDVRDLDAPRPDSDIPTFLQLMTTGAMRTNGLESFKKSGTDPEIDEFQESLLWLREEVEKEVTKERQLEVFGAASEADGTLYRLERAQAESRGTFREVGDRLVMLHMPNGDAIEQPSEHDIDTAVSAASGKQTWIEELNQAVVSLHTDGRLQLLTEDHEKSVEGNDADAKQAFNLLRNGRHDQLATMFGAPRP